MSEQKGRFIVEGEWSGYRSSQQRVVHRTVHPGSEMALRAWCEAHYGIRYSDGTMLRLSVRPCRPRERVNVVNGYGSLIRDCVRYGVDSVEGLYRAKAEGKS